MLNNNKIKSKIKSLCGIVFICLFTIIFGLTLTASVVFAQKKNNGIFVPPEAVFPLGALSTEKPALFDVVSEPVQSIGSSSNPVLFSIILAILLSVFLLLFFKFRKYLLKKR